MRAADSVGASIAESYGRFHDGDKAHFLYYARGSACETLYWNRRAQQRGLIEEATATKAADCCKALILSLNAFIRRRKSRKGPPSAHKGATGRIGEGAATCAIPVAISEPDAAFPSAACEDACEDPFQPSLQSPSPPVLRSSSPLNLTHPAPCVIINCYTLNHLTCAAACCRARLLVEAGP